MIESKTRHAYFAIARINPANSAGHFLPSVQFLDKNEHWTDNRAEAFQHADQLGALKLAEWFHDAFVVVGFQMEFSPKAVETSTASLRPKAPLS